MVLGGSGSWGSGGSEMGRRESLITKYAQDLRDKCGLAPDVQLLEKVAIGCGPLIYHPDASLVSANDPAELAQIKNNFLNRKLGLPDSPALNAAIDAMIDIYGRSEPCKYRAVIYYLLVRHFGKEDHYP